MTTNTPDPLLVAVDALTKPQQVVEWQEAVPEKGIERAIKKRTNPPLLDWLALSVANNLGGGGGGKPARERTPIDIAALTLYESIDERVKSWLAELGAKPGKNVTPTQVLRSWYALWIGGHHNDGIERAYTSVLEAWEQRILDILDPPKRIEITAPCPACGQEWHNLGLKLEDGTDDPDDAERVRVLNAVERATLQDSYAMCTACNRVWAGVSQMRQLRIAMDDAEAARLAQTA
jgi:hypothetical protein